MLKSILISLITLSSLVNFANAGIISGNAIPSSLEVNSDPESDTDIFLYAERQNVMLGADLDVDFLAATGLSGSLLAGTTVNSFIFNYDAVGTDYSRGSFNATGTHFFDTKILAVIWTGSRPGAQPQTAKNLGKSDSILGVAGVTYPTDFLGRGLELEAAFYGANGTNDVFTVSGNQIDLSLFARAPYSDQLRVITAAKVEVPEPAAIVLFGTALCLFGFRRFSK